MNEYELLREPAHMATVWKAIEKSIPKYWDLFVKEGHLRSPAAKLASKLGNAAPAKEGAVIGQVFEEAVDEYEKAAEKYRKFFDPVAMDEYMDDPNAFKQGLSRDAPVIANTLRNRQTELKEWQMHFRSARSNDLLSVFTNVLDFREDWSKGHSPKKYATYDAPDDFGVDPLDEDESMGLVNVVGMGIKSIILHHLDPERFPLRGRNGLYGLYFLSGNDHFNLPSKTSEFLMINDKRPASDGSLIMDQNYYYPYAAFSVYAIRVFRWIEQRAKSAGFAVDAKLRYVYVERFFGSVCDQHVAHLRTMRAHERFEVPA